MNLRNSRTGGGDIAGGSTVATWTRLDGIGAWMTRGRVSAIHEGTVVGGVCHRGVPAYKRLLSSTGIAFEILKPRRRLCNVNGIACGHKCCCGWYGELKIFLFVLEIADYNGVYAMKFKAYFKISAIYKKNNIQQYWIIFALILSAPHLIVFPFRGGKRKLQNKKKIILW